MGNPTTQSYTSLAMAYDFFNKRLFNGKLPPCLITMQRHKGSYGYFSAGRFANAADPNEITDEIALNPVHFSKRPPAEVLSTLAHEMTHLWRHYQGNPPTRGYHDRMWADKMVSIGLIPSRTGAEGGQMTGQHVTHLIEKGGLYANTVAELFGEHTAVLYADRVEELDAYRLKKMASKTKYTCPSCGLNAWAKPKAALVCGNCEEAMEAKARV